MTEDFVTYELSVKLKEKGFDYETRDVYERNILACRYEDYPKPTTSQVLKWLREEKNIHIEIYTNASGYNYIISDTPKLGGSDKYWSEYEGPNDSGCWDSYEECVITAIERVLDNLI